MVRWEIGRRSHGETTIRFGNVGIRYHGFRIVVKAHLSLRFGSHRSKPKKAAYDDRCIDLVHVIGRVLENVKVISEASEEAVSGCVNVEC